MQKEENEEEEHQLWTFLESSLKTLCDRYETSSKNLIEPMIDVLSVVIQKYKVEDLSKRLLLHVFLQMKGKIVNNVNLNILLMNNGIISISEWDK
jgi:hypothetical protein